MIVAGIGCKKGSTENQVTEALAAALAAQQLDLAVLDALATGAMKRDETAIFDTARSLGLKVVVVDDAALKATGDRCLTHSDKSLLYSGLSSLCEAAALAAAGDGATLLGPRLVRDGVTCALARSSPQTGDRP